MEFEGPQAAQYAALNLQQRLEQFERLVVLCREMQAPVVFGHNDLLSGNILVPREVWWGVGWGGVGGVW